MTIPIINRCKTLQGHIENQSLLLGKLTEDGIQRLNLSYSRGFPLAKDLGFINCDVVYTIIGAAISGVLLTEVPEYKRRKKI